MKLKIIIPGIIVLVITALIYTTAVKNPYKIMVDVEESKLYVFKDGSLYKTYPCAGGTLKTPSPIGTFTKVSKDNWGEGFGGSWMGFDCTWGKFGIHGTLEPHTIGWCSSHGCIRMYNKEVAELNKYIPHGTKVTIVDGPYGNFGRGFRVLRPGMYGADVKEVQKRLKELGFFFGHVDGFYHDSLKQAAFRYQKSLGMSVSNDITPKLQEKMGFYLMD